VVSGSFYATTTCVSSVPADIVASLAVLTISTAAVSCSTYAPVDSFSFYPS